MRLDVDVAGAAVTLLCKLVWTVSEVVLILVVLAVNADERLMTQSRSPLVLVVFTFLSIFFMVYAAVAFYIHGGIR